MAQGGLNDEKNWRSKISLGCPFNNETYTSAAYPEHFDADPTNVRKNYYYVHSWFEYLYVKNTYFDQTNKYLWNKNKQLQIK